MRVTLGLLVAVVVLGLVFVLDTESWYLLFKALHVVASVTWVGGGLLLTLLAVRAERASSNEGLLTIGEQADWAGHRLFVPSSFLVLATGIAMTINGDLEWGDFWVIFGLIAWATSTAIGIGYLTPKVKQFTSVVRERGPMDPEAQSLMQNVILAARIDVALLVLIVIDMTVKPFS